MNIKLNQKAVASLFSLILYIFITIAVLGVVSRFGLVQINRYQEQYKYEETIKTINRIEETIYDVASNKSNISEITAYNPEYLELDCTTNKITAYITSKTNYRKDTNSIINGINTYKKQGKIYFEKDFSENNNITLNCNSIILNKGRNRLNINYFEYDSINDKIKLDLFIKKPTITNYWYNSKWLYRKKITIDDSKIEGILEDFPVYIELTDINLANYANSDGSDLVFTLDNGKTKLNFDIEDYNSEIGKLDVWVSIPELSSTKNTNLYLYYGNSDANVTNQNMWNENYFAVYHLNETVANEAYGFYDSTDNNNLIKPYFFNDDETSKTGVTGKLNNAVLFDGVNDRIANEMDTSHITDNNKLSFSLWAQSENEGSGSDIVLGVNYPSGNRIYVGRISQQYWSSGAGDVSWAGEDVFADTNWTYVTLNIDQENKISTLYINGVEARTINYTTDIEVTMSPTIGTLNTDTGYCFDGYIDEYRFSKNLKSSHWIKTEYNNQYNPSEFYTVGEQEGI